MSGQSETGKKEDFKKQTRPRRNVGQDVNEKQLHARQYGSPLISGVRAGREERCFWMSWQQSTSGLRQILGVNRPPSNVP